MITIPFYQKKEDLYSWLRANKSLLIREKKSMLKHADGIGAVFVSVDPSKWIAVKEDITPVVSETGTYAIKAVINACGIMDSHLDVHISGCWKKSAKETKSGLFLQEHEMKFENVISENVQVYTATMTWKDLGFNYTGDTEVLINDVIAEKKRNTFMYDQYANKWVSQHSVGMIYVNYFLCMNSESKWDVEEKASWDKYYPMVVNKEMADEYGFFFAVTEAKYREGSAVVRGSCPATPTISFEPGEPTQTKTIEPPAKALDIDKLIKAFNN